MNQSGWIALIVVGILVIIGVVLYLVLGRKSSSSIAVLIPVLQPTHPNGYRPHPNGYNPGPGPLPPNGYNPGPGPLPPNGYNPSLPPGPGPHPNGYNPNLTPPPVHKLLPGATLKDLSEAFAPAL
jgi:hypothetical protein